MQRLYLAKSIFVYFSCLLCVDLAKPIIIIIMSDDDLNLSWTQEFQQSIHSDSIPSTELPSYIKIHFVYLSGENDIERVDTIDHILDIVNDQSKIDEMQWLQWIEQRKMVDKKPYRFFDLVSFLVDLDSTHLARTEVLEFKECKSWGIPQNISIPPTFTMLHSVNAIWIFFRELICVNTLQRNLSPVSILKRGGVGRSIQTKKRVRLCLPDRSKTAKVY